MSKSRMAVVSAAAVLLLVGCGASSDSASGGGKKDCSLVTASHVNGILGTSYAEPDATTNGSVTVCTFASADKLQNGIVRFEEATASLKAERDSFGASGQSTNDLAGVGDEAFSSTTGGSGLIPATNTVVARKGTKNVQVVSQASIELEAKLANDLLSKF
jgi:hypothetical protein